MQYSFDVMSLSIIIFTNFLSSFRTKKYSDIIGCTWNCTCIYIQYTVKYSSMSFYSLLYDSGHGQHWYTCEQNMKAHSQWNIWKDVCPAKMCTENLESIYCTMSMLGKSTNRQNTHIHTPLPSSRPVTQNVTLASGVYPPPPKLKQGGQKDIFQFSRCESFHLVI